jgi:hypothetical protein
MRRQSSSIRTTLVLVSLGILVACGKRADPLAPYVKTPSPPSALEVAQIGQEVEIRVMAPRTTTENRPLPVIEIEWYQAPATGDFGKTALPLFREEVAPGEIRTKRFPRPGVDVRFAVRAFQGKAQSNFGAPVPFKPAPVPERPTDLTATNTAVGIELHWTNPPGAEPWPTPSVSPSPSPSPTGSPAASLQPSPSPSLSEPAPSRELPPPAVGGGPPGEPPGNQKGSGPPPLPGPPFDKIAVQPGKPAPTPTTTPAPPTGIRIFRTDGAPRLAREPLQASSWIDLTPKPGEKPCYSLRYATSLKPLVESAPTEPVCVETKDIVPPEPPSRFVADISATFVELSWTASISSDVAFYRIYVVTAPGQRTLFLETDGPILRVRDPNTKTGPRAYQISAVDKAGNESAISPPLTVFVP